MTTWEPSFADDPEADVCVLIHWLAGGSQRSFMAKATTRINAAIPMPAQRDQCLDSVFMIATSEDGPYRVRNRIPGSATNEAKVHIRMDNKGIPDGCGSVPREILTR